MGDPVRRGLARRAWSLAAGTALLVVLVAWWAPRMGADTPLGTTGLTAHHILFDEPAEPGARCVLDPDTQTVTFTVTAPFVFGLDRDPHHVESTSVTWKAVLLHDGITVDQSDRQYGTAGDGGSATFTPISLTTPAVPGVLSIQVEIQWLDFPQMPQESVLGTSLRRVDHYRQDLSDGNGARVVQGGCQVAEEPTPLPTNTPIPPTATSTAAPTFIATPEPTATREPTATATPDPTATSTATGTPAPTVTPTPEPTQTPPPTATNTPAPTATATPSPTLTPVPTATQTPSPTATPTTTSTPTPIATHTSTPTATNTPAPTPTATPSPPSVPNGPPAMTTSSTRGIVNANLRITLSGFAPNTYVEITFSGVTVAALTTTIDGTVVVTIKVPARPAGTYPLRAVAGSESAFATYTIAPRIKVIPGNAGPGDQVEISLRGFGRNEAVRIRWLVDGRWVQVGHVPRTSNTGSANILVTVPEGAAPGPAKVRGDGPIARAQTNAFTVTE